MGSGRGWHLVLTVNQRKLSSILRLPTKNLATLAKKWRTLMEEEIEILDEEFDELSDAEAEALFKEQFSDY